MKHFLNYSLRRWSGIVTLVIITFVVIELAVRMIVLWLVDLQKLLVFLSKVVLRIWLLLIADLILLLFDI